MYGIPDWSRFLVSVMSPPSTIVEPFGTRTLVLISWVLMIFTRLPEMFFSAPRVSFFWAMTRLTSRSELMSGMTSSWRTTSWYPTLDATDEPLPLTPPPVAVVRELWGYGTRCPEKIVAFRLLVV